MIDASRLIFIHGSGGDKSQTYKARILRGLFPGMVTPDFTGSLSERMAQLEAILGDQTGWTIIGSSLGGLMAALFTCQRPQQVRKLILLAPALNLPDFTQHLPTPLAVPTVIIHGRRDDVVPLEPVQELARRVFTTLTYTIVDDDHRLMATAHKIDWRALLES